MAVFHEIKKLNIKVPAKINTLLKKLYKADIKEEQIDETPAVTDMPDGLIEIQKETVSVQSQTKVSSFLRVCEIAYIVLFCGIAFWRIYEMIVRFTLSVRGYYSIVTAVLLAVFPCVALIYLKMRKGEDNQHPCDKTSYDMLTLSSYVLFVYSAVIAASLVLKINILIVLPWLYCVLLVYLVGAMAFNILLSVIKKDILGDFNYTLFLKFSKTKDKKEEKDNFFDTNEVKQNFSLKSLYTIKYALKIMPAVILGLGFILFLSTTVFVVQPHQQAIVYHLGKPSPVTGEGIHFKLPWPIDKADIYDVRRVNSMQIGYESPYSAHYLWTRAHDGGENTLLLGNGNEMVAVNIKIIYIITDLYAYVNNHTNPEEVLSAAAYTALMNRTVDTTLDEFLSVDRNSLSASVARELSQFCSSNGLGLSVLQVIVESIHPPVEIADIYQRVVTALVTKNTMITRAITTAEKRIIDAQQDRITVVNNATARKFIRISSAQKEMAVYYAAMEAYAINPTAMQTVKYVETYEKIIGGHKVYVFSPAMESAVSRAIIGNTNKVNTLSAGEIYE
jgi:membrane protease subunit HflK